MTTYACKDGTPFHVSWVEPDDENATWTLNDSHYPKPFPAMGVALQEVGSPGRARAYREAGVEPVPKFHHFLFVNGYQYTCESPPPPGVLAGYAAFRAAHGGSVRGPWDSFCEPRIRRAVAEIAGAGPDARVTDLAQAYLYGWHQTFSSIGAVNGVVGALSGLLVEAYGQQTPLVVQELAQGGENATLAIDEELGSLAAVARANPAIATALDAPSYGTFQERVQEAAGGPAFAAQLAQFIARHWHRSTSWALLDPTWGERPEAIIEILGSLARSEAVPTAEKARQSSAAQAARLAELSGRLTPENAEKAGRLVRELDGYVHVREGRAYWQMTIVGAMRHALLRVGGKLRDAGCVDDPGDVFFLVPDETDSARPGDLRGAVAARRAAWEQWCAIRPPDWVGAPPAMQGLPDAAIAGELRGLPASRGRITARARILAEPADGHLLGQGEVLVCVMTTPAWTSLFGVAGAVVTETGAPLSHPAIAAREYGIPCVVGVKGATTLIPDGATVEIDGERGTIRVLA